MLGVLLHNFHEVWLSIKYMRRFEKRSSFTPSKWLTVRPNICNSDHLSNLITFVHIQSNLFCALFNYALNVL